ncbi:metalloregulator ArsR/SmtB family transcription factor [Flammeovirga yaeyamensis]|uniref:Metalloregulator ArsR/SmtB family transcription factor n=1 Tax=Flammeovirga yaeyamensis TaxID=367791 RepID=A0AAX1NDD0_9BACT|nr:MULTISPECIES: metalloregulator ArsR/SmtB family transcription factor [Flammeovirga]ANQ52695.1 winged helix-turn-helix transcriptional regulator [Flammeovirga sp. MY04]MBB3697115.1 DNA-binding transcriptional ArsR family regulator [Flammeovirga yaeyamensis]NMF33778.1 winged helix-turn-helix transcriptional regulator [Flammeovirga yaeyamensis]QWG04956.1 metalloregulator ArsR/SmtB family transcription factor [Flammeovirga yaeyamensis]
MGITKTEGFDTEVTEMSDILKVLGHPARLSILLHLINAPQCINGDLVGVLPLAQSTVSRHLNELKRVGLIKGSISGNNVSYCVNEELWEKVSLFFSSNLNQLSPKKCC